MQPLLQYKSNNYYIFQKCVFVALGIQHAMHMLHIVICDLSSSTIFFHIISLQRHDFWRRETEIVEKKEVATNKMCFDFLYNFV
jgi:hypothetical protein